MLRILRKIILVLATSFFLFPFSFPFLPEALNTKIIVAAFGLLALAFNSVRQRSFSFSEPTLFATLLAGIFSVWCLFSVTINNTYDTIYADYIVSFATWMAGAYGVYSLLQWEYEKVDLEILTRYLTLVGVFQCVSAVLIDNISFVERLVDHIMYQPGDFYKVNHRMYGLGAALDPAGVRFSVILIMIAHQFSTNPNVRAIRLYQATDLGAFAIIVVIGAVISRTTLVGAGMGLAYIVISLFRMRKGGFITTSMVRMFFWFFIVMIVIVGTSIYFYRTSDTFQSYLRFGFEAFFNWVETGEFRTNSTDILESMWVWPDNLETWLIGRGTFGVFDNDTDIGYCNFTLYCGLIGLIIFSVFFIYCHTVQIRKFRHFELAAWMLVALTFIVWIKVATDIFFIDALLFCVVGDYEGEEEAVSYADRIVPDDIRVRK